jgi:hypothetical protein
VPAVCGSNQPKSLTKMSQLSLPKRPWFSPFLLDSVLPAGFGLTYSKQTTEKFLPDTRTHIKVFQVLIIYDTKSRPVDTTPVQEKVREKGQRFEGRREATVRKSKLTKTPA